MGLKIFIALSSNLLVAVDRLAGSKHSRSGVIEQLLRRYFKGAGNPDAQVRDLELINLHEEALNRESADVLIYQCGNRQ
jgi:metal-responsive CopG/Arc/MetJ family transcriptional regulator